ncbi:MAG: hypothetical protein GY710_10410 [Desulfobacteraceae bacterium]|nr:hypothetical protein [Desulfobacteraceae bacterium]
MPKKKKNLRRRRKHESPINNDRTLEGIFVCLFLCLCFIALLLVYIDRSIEQYEFYKDGIKINGYIVDYWYKDSYESMSSYDRSRQRVRNHYITLKYKPNDEDIIISMPVNHQYSVGNSVPVTYERSNPNHVRIGKYEGKKSMVEIIGLDNYKFYPGYIFICFMIILGGWGFLKGMYIYIYNIPPWKR